MLFYNYPKPPTDFTQTNGMEQGIIDLVFGFIRREQELFPVDSQFYHIAPLIYHVCLQYFSYESDEFDELTVNHELDEFDRLQNYSSYKIVSQVIHRQSLERLKKLEAMIDREAFVKSIFCIDGQYRNAIEWAIAGAEETCEILKYLLSFDEIRQKYMANENLLWRFVYSISARLSPQVILDTG